MPDPQPTKTAAAGRLARLGLSVRRWVDAGAGVPAAERGAQEVDWPRILPFVLMHAGCLGVLWVGWSPAALLVAVGLYVVRMFAITGFYHRYFSHRAFKTSRAAQFAFAVLGNSAVQRGPIWWAAHHRQHHRHADAGPKDIHSPRIYSLLWSHIGWITCKANFATDLRQVPDLAKFPELRLLDRFNVVVPLLLAVSLYVSGAVLESVAPALGTSGWQMVVWGFFISTVLLFHGTFTINSLAHRFGTRRYATPDDSRNNWLLALITLGEGWHNNHHRYPAAVRQGHRWWEIDVTTYLLVLLSKIGVVWDLKPLPERIRRSG